MNKGNHQGSDQHLMPTLKDFRNKLLDLTARNKLLNLKLDDQRAGRLLRLVDCSLQEVLNGLTSGRQYSLSALPEPAEEKQIAIDEEVLDAALAQARAEDPLYQQILIDSEGDPSTVTTLAQEERRLLNGVLQALGQSPMNEQSAKQLATWAEIQGIDISYSLATATSDRVQGNSLLVMLSEQQLGRSAETIRRAAQS
jgi:hypothetical protein